MIKRVILIHSDRGRVVDGIRDHSQRLAEELSRQSVNVEIRTQTAGVRGGGLMDSLWSWRELRRSADASAIVLQYSPFCFARWGFAPWLPAFLWAIRTVSKQPKLAIMVHEPYVPMDSWQSIAMGLWQRLQLSALRFGADIVFTSIEPWATKLRRQPPWRRVHHLPVGSNFPDRRPQRYDARKRIGIDDNALVVATLGRDHPAWLSEYVVRAGNAIAEVGTPVVLLSLGAEAPILSGLDPRITVHAPGFLEAGELANMLSASDLFLAPLVDGVSTRRTALMAALQHSLPVVGTAGPLTDPILRESKSAIRLTRVGDPELFASAAVELAGDASDRESARVAARQFYECNFDWPVIVRTMLDAFADR